MDCCSPSRRLISPICFLSQLPCHLRQAKSKVGALLWNPRWVSLQTAVGSGAPFWLQSRRVSFSLFYWKIEIWGIRVFPYWFFRAKWKLHSVQNQESATLSGDKADAGVARSTGHTHSLCGIFQHGRATTNFWPTENDFWNENFFFFSWKESWRKRPKWELWKLSFQFLLSVHWE